MKFEVEQNAAEVPERIHIYYLYCNSTQRTHVRICSVT